MPVAFTPTRQSLTELPHPVEVAATESTLLLQK